MADMFRLSAINAFSDNYIWVLHDHRQAIAVDPGDAAPLETFLQAQGLTLQAVWITHHHADHIGGLPQLATRWPSVPVYGPAGVAGVTRPVADGDTLGAFGSTVQVMATPGHTANHLVYLAGQHLLCGDTLFGAGCGRVFDGTLAQLFHSLRRLASLPDETLCYPAHEYTLANLAFAAAVEPDNLAVRQRLARDANRRDGGQATLPSRLVEERSSNPFLRTAEATVQASAANWAGTPLGDEVAVFSALRQWKNHF